MAHLVDIDLLWCANFFQRNKVRHGALCLFKMYFVQPCPNGQSCAFERERDAVIVKLQEMKTLQRQDPILDRFFTRS